MADQRHLHILDQGVDGWKRWRLDHPEPQRGGPLPGGPPQGKPHRGEPPRGDPLRGGPHRGGPHRGIAGSHQSHEGYTHGLPRLWDFGLAGEPSGRAPDRPGHYPGGRIRSHHRQSRSCSVHLQSPQQPEAETGDRHHHVQGCIDPGPFL